MLQHFVTEKNRIGDTLMKKFLSLILILAMLTVAMVSCKKDDPTEDPTPAPPAVTTRYTITAEEWAAVLTLKNYTAEITNSQTQILNGGEPEVQSSTGIAKSTDTVCYQEQRDGDDVYKTYIVVENGKNYHVRELDDGTFAAYVYDYGIDSLAEYYTFETVTFADLTYNAETKAYTFTVSNDTIDAQYTMWFENGKVVKLTAVASREMSYGEGENAMSVYAEMRVVLVITNVGTTTVATPNFERPTE